MGITFSGGGPRRTTANAVAHQRLNNALVQYRTLEREWQRWMKGTDLGYEIQGKGQGEWVEIVARVSRPVDESLATPAKACLGEVRSALDNMIVALVKEAGGDGAALKRASFPIVDCDSSWARASKGRLRHLSDDIVQRVRDLQSWSMPSSGDRAHPLAFLDDILNTDKHREPMEVVLGTNFRNGVSLLFDVQFQVPRTSTLAQVDSLTPNEVDEMTRLTVGVIRDGTVLAGVKLPENASNVRVTPAPSSFALMAVKDGILKPDPLFPQLMNLMRYVREGADYVTGVTSEIPPSWAPGEGIGM